MAYTTTGTYAGTISKKSPASFTGAYSKGMSLKAKSVLQKKTGDEEELPVQAKHVAQLQEEPEEEMPVQGKFVFQREELHEEEPVQGKFAILRKEENKNSASDNKTGLPDNLRAGVENLSGFSMNNVKVHYNSDKPAQLNALAYAQGADIHVGPGQEKHLPHEAWHIVQQMQGRVQPTFQMKENIPVNDDPGLEKEADVMGQKSLQFKLRNAPNSIKQFVPTISGFAVTLPKTLQLLSSKNEAEIEKEKSYESLDRLVHLLNAIENPSTTVRIVVRSAAPGKAGDDAGVGHSAIQVSVTSGLQHGDIQVGMDNKSLVKMEGEVARENRQDKYVHTYLEKSIDKNTALHFIDRLKSEIGNSHYYLEKLGPGTQYTGYENCSSWAEKMAREAGMDFPPQPPISLFVRPTELAKRLGEAGNKEGQSLVTLDTKGATHPGIPAVAEGDPAVIRDAIKWLCVQGLIEDLEAKKTMRTKEQLRVDLVGEAIPADVYASAVLLAQKIDAVPDKQKGVSGTVVIGGIGLAALAVGLFFWQKRSE